MKKFKLLLLLIGLIYLGCTKEEITSIGQEGTYAANFDFPTGTLGAPAKVVLTNRSKNADRFEWEFTGGKTLNKSGVSNATTSNKMVPDTILYELPGEYTVKLTTWQGDKREEISKKITLIKMQPRIIAPDNIAVFEDVQFDARAFNYPGQNVTYSWDFGASGTSTLKSPLVQFTTEGEKTIKLTVNDGQETLTTEIKILVKGELAKTIYFTDVITKKIYSYKLTLLSPSTPVDLLIATGPSPLGLSVTGNKLYYSETGLGLRFSSPPNTLPDGYLKSFNLDGSGEALIARNTNQTEAYNADPWLHAVDKDGNIWWTSRTNGIFTANAAAVEIPYPAFKIRGGGMPSYATNTHFYSGIKEVGDEIWVSLTGGSAGVGIARYTKAGVFVDYLAGPVRSLGIRQFVIDKVNKHIYFSISKAGTYTTGIYRSDMSGNNIVAIDNGVNMQYGGAEGFSDQGGQGTGIEGIHVTGMDIDVDENGQGYLYYGYRNAAEISGNNAPQVISATAGTKSGIKRYKLGTSGQIDFLLKGYAPYGLAIDQVKR
ncbi:PKD domain protein [compost metagenome]